MTKKRPTIGFFTDWIENSYHLAILTGIIEKAKQLDVNILTFVGGAVNSPRNHEKLRNIIYQLATPQNIDGLIISSGSVGHFLTYSQLAEFIKGYEALPIVSISQEIENVHSIIVDNKPGLHDMIIHLVQSHGYRRPAFITGPDNNRDSAERLQVYKNTLQECHLPVDPDYIARGDFTFETGILAVKDLLDNRKVRPDVIITANDAMAIGVLEELQRRDISVPYEIAVTGFDDQLPCRYTNPTLTSVRQPLLEQGSKALEILLAMGSGEMVPELTMLPTIAVFRESCGCLSTLMEYQSISLKEKEFENNKAISIQVKEYPYKDMLNRISAIFPAEKKFEMREITEIIVRLLSDAVKIYKGDEVIKALKTFLYSRLNNGIDENVWEQWLSFFRLFIYPEINNDKSNIFFEELLFTIKLIVKDYYARLNSNQFIERENVINKFRDISESLTAMNSLEEIATLLEERLPEIGVRSCYFSLYEDHGKYHPCSSQSRLILAFDHQGPILVDKEFTSFPTEQLVPSGVINQNIRFFLYVDPLFSGTQQLGIAMYEIDRLGGLTFDVMRRMLLNSALKGAVFTQQVQEQADFLEETNKELRDTLATLKKTQDKLVESEKMAALGGLVTGIAHEINTPVGIGVTAASHLEKITGHLLTKYSTNTLKKSDLEGFIHTAQQASAMVLTNLERAQKLISSFKMIAVDQVSEEKRLFSLKDYIEEILLNLKPRLKKMRLNITIKCDEELEINSYPGSYTQIITNLVMNSLIHAYTPENEGSIVFDIRRRNNSLVLNYSDDGKGIEKKHLKKIFDPFFTTNRAGAGVGLGLYLVYNIVTQTLGGTIRCMSRPGHGTTFVIEIPLDDESDEYSWDE